MKRFHPSITVAAILLGMLAPVFADTTPITAGLNAPAIDFTGGAEVIWGPLVSQSYLQMSGSANNNYPQKITGSFIQGNGGTAGGRDMCVGNSTPASGPGTIIPPSSVPVYEWFCNQPAPPAPQISFEDYKYLAQSQGNSCGGQPCYNTDTSPQLSGINDTTCLVNGQPKVWFFEGSPKFSGGTYFCGVMVVKGAVDFTGNGVGSVTITPPLDAYKQYEVATPNGTSGFGDTSASDEYPGDAGLHAVKPYTISGVTFNGYIYSSTGYNGGGGSTIVGSVQFGAGSASSSGGGTIYFQPTVIFSPPPPNTVNMPIITPPGGNFISPVQVTIADTTPGAIIHYTLDGSVPTAASPIYSAAFTLSTNTTVKAIGTLSGMNDSAVATAVFTFSTGGGGTKPAPILTSLMPPSVPAGNPSFTLTLNGSQFVDGAIATWNNAPLSTTFMNAGMLTAAIPAGNVIAAGSANIQVTNPDTQKSGILTFTITTSTGGGGGTSVLDHIVVSPSSATLGVGSQIAFSAIAYNSNNAVMSNVQFDWAVSGLNSIAPISNSTWTLLTAGTVPGLYSLTASSNGITGQAIVAVQGGGVSGGLFIVDPASANPNPVPGTSTHLHVLAESTNPGPITYQWDFTGLAAVIATPNAPDSDVTFTQPGSYQFNVTITDSQGLRLTSQVIVSVVRTVTRVVVLPPVAITTVGQNFPFTATAVDQFDQPMSTSFTWSASVGTINGSGSYMSLNPVQNVTIMARAPNGVAGTALMTVQGTGLVGGGGDLSNAKAYPVPYKSTSGSAGITFSGLTEGTTIKLFTLDGHLVQTLHSDGANVLWMVNNSRNEKVASGLYYFRIENANQVKEGKIVIIQ